MLISNKKIIAFTLLITIALTAGYAQEKSAGRAVILSALLPGAGQIYLGNHTRGGAFLGAELLLVLSYTRLNNEVGWKINSYKQYANLHADVPLDSDDNYYRFISSYISSDDYNAGVERYFRNLYIIYRYDPQLYSENLDRYLVTGDEEWQWSSRDNWLRYRELRRETQELEIFSNFAIGASILNRLVSVIDTALIARSLRRGGSNEINDHTSFLSDITIQPDFQHNGITFKYQYRF